MYTSFSTALSAMNAESTAIDVVGNNLANLNTTGFKASDVSFHELVAQSLGSGFGQAQVGFGVGRPATFRNFTQGALQSTSGPLDAAIQGDGFFIVQGAAGGMEFTRAGSFHVDKSGNLVTGTGEKVQGWSQVNGVLDTNGPPGAMSIPVGTVSAPVATSKMSFDMNLNAAASAGPPPDTFSTAIQVFDSLGEAHIVTAAFTKNATANKWDYSLTVPNSDVKSPFTPVTGSLTFDSQGKLASPAATAPPTNIQIKGLSSGAADLSMDWSLFDNGNARVTQFAQASGVSAVTQDGSSTAQLVRVAVGEGGQVVAEFSNGHQQVVGQLAMALIRNPESLSSAGNNNYSLSSLTAAPAIGIPGTGGRGSISGGSLESSTVDIAREFTKLIVLQRGYQANSRVVSTVDQLSQETINLIHQ